MDITTDFKGDNGFVKLHAIISYALLILALFLNLLVFCLVSYSNKVYAFRYVFYTYCATNIVFAVGYSISLTQWVQIPGMIIFFPTGPFANDVVITPYVFRSQSFIYFFVMCLVCSTFVYRYFIVAQPNFNQYKRKMIVLSTFAPVFLWFVDSSLISIPGVEIRRRLNAEFGARFAVNFERIYIFSVVVSTSEINALSIFGVFFSAIQLSAMLWTGMRIYRTIQESLGSNKQKIMERNAFRLLISQAINPLLLLHIPTFLNFVQAEIVTLPEIVNQLSSIAMNVFAVSNPLLNIIFSGDLKNSLKTRLSRRKKSSISVVHL